MTIPQPPGLFEECAGLAREAIRELPLYSPGMSPEEVKSAYGVERVIKLASNENPLGPSPLAVEAVKREASQISTYPDGTCRELREALSGKLGVSPERFIFGNGTDEVIDFLFYAFFETGDAAVMGDPTFSSYFLSGMTMGARMSYVPLRDHSHYVEKMLEAVDESTKAVFVGTPHNPTGSICDERELSKMLQGLPARVLLIWDEAYYEYVDDPSYPDSLSYIDDHPNLVILRTFSKAYGLAGLRVGYGIAHPEVVRYLERVRPPFNVNRLGQTAAVAALGDEDYLEEVKRVNREGKRYLTEHLSGIGFEVVPTQANFVLVKYGHLLDDLADMLLERGIIVRDGKSLGYPGYVRLTIGTPDQNREVVETLEVLVS